VWIGANVTILPGVTIGDHTVIGAGSVVTKNVAANSIAVGVPARVIREFRSDESLQAVPVADGIG
jgi:acetyltransferase-like isoleucine patch superfamily enzyme